MKNQMVHSYDKLEAHDHQAYSSEKYFFRVMAVLAVVLTVLFIVTSVQHIWFTQVLINGMAG